MYAQIGKGHYVYSAYSWFRELPDGVPGAYRIVANLVSLGAKRDERRRRRPSGRRRGRRSGSTVGRVDGYSALSIGMGSPLQARFAVQSRGASVQNGSVAGRPSGRKAAEQR